MSLRFNSSLGTGKIPEEDLEEFFRSLLGLCPQLPRAGGWEPRHLPYRDYAGGEDISRSEQLQIKSNPTLSPLCPGSSSTLDAEAVQDFLGQPGFVGETVAGQA